MSDVKQGAAPEWAIREAAILAHKGSKVGVYARALAAAYARGREEAAKIAEHPVGDDPCAMDKWCAVADDADRAALKDWEDRIYQGLDGDDAELAWLCWHASAQYWLKRARDERAAAIRAGGA